MAEVEEGVPGEPEPEPQETPAAAGGGGMRVTKSKRADTSTKHKQLNKLVLENLMRAYREKLRPLELSSGFSVMNQPLSDAEFNAPPSVMLIGQYSVGKTTFIRNLLGKGFNERIGPEPTTVRQQQPLAPTRIGNLRANSRTKYTVVLEGSVLSVGIVGSGALLTVPCCVLRRTSSRSSFTATTMWWCPATHSQCRQTSRTDP